MLKRKVQHWGFVYPYGIREPQTPVLQRVERETPRWLVKLTQFLLAKEILTEEPNQWIINRYEPGQGIGAHRDHAMLFGNEIATLSLGSPVEMDFRPINPKPSNHHEAGDDADNNIRGDARPVSLLLNPGDLLVFKDAARMEWSHAIGKKKTYLGEDGKRRARSVRISITFRRYLQAP